MQMKLEALLSADDSGVVRYAAGALQNMVTAANSEEKPMLMSPLSMKSQTAINDRVRQVRQLQRSLGVHNVHGRGVGHHRLRCFLSSLRRRLRILLGLVLRLPYLAP